MLKKLFIILFLHLRCDDETFKKKLHLYVVGHTMYIAKDKRSTCNNEAPKIYTESNGPGLTGDQIGRIRNDMKTNGTTNAFDNPIIPDILNQEPNTVLHLQSIQHPKIYLAYHKDKSNDEHTNRLSEAITKSKEIQEKHIGATLSIYLFEFKEMMSGGLFIGTDHMAEDYIEFTAQIASLKKKGDANTNNDGQNGINEVTKKGNGIVFLKRRTPISLGGFIQVQNTDLDSFLYALKLNFGVGLTTIHALIKDVDFFTNEKLVNKQKALIAKKISLSLSASIILRYKDLEVFLIGGISWIPKGAEATCISFDYQPTTDTTRKNGQIPFKRIQNNSVTLNHLCVYIGIGLGWNFN